MIGAVLISEPPLIPIWFYSYSAMVYSLAAIVSFLVSFFSLKLYRTSSFKRSLLLLFSFLALGLAFSSLTVASVYTYFYKPYFETFHNLSRVNSQGFNLYYLASLTAYLLFLMMYLPGKFKFKHRFFVLYVPLWYINLTNFHIASILLLACAVIKNVVNFYKRRNTNSFLVTFAFVAIVAFHLLQLLIPFDVELYLLSHIILTVGFASLLTMLIRVSRR